MSQHRVWLPRRVQAGVISETFGDGTAVVVQLDSQQAHSLDALAARVWELADGTRSVTAVALAAGVPAERVEATLAQLADLGLLEDDVVGGHSRRSVLARAAQLGGGLVLTGGVINSMALPAAADAVSNVLQNVQIQYDGSNYSYTPEGGSTATNLSNIIYLTDNGVVPMSSGTPNGAYVLIDAYQMSYVNLQFYANGTGATASYGNGSTVSSATISLASSGTPANPTPTAGTGTSTLWVTIGT